MVLCKTCKNARFRDPRASPPWSRCHTCASPGLSALYQLLCCQKAAVGVGPTDASSPVTAKRLRPAAITWAKVRGLAHFLVLHVPPSSLDVSQNSGALKNCLDVVLDSAAASRYRNWVNFETKSFSPCILQPWFVTQHQEVITIQYYTPSWKSLFYQNIT